jgi:hypothetical protein
VALFEDLMVSPWVILGVGKTWCRSFRDGVTCRSAVLIGESGSLDRMLLSHVSPMNGVCV